MNASQHADDDIAKLVLLGSSFRVSGAKCCWLLSCSNRRLTRGMLWCQRVFSKRDSHTNFVDDVVEGQVFTGEGNGVRLLLSPTSCKLNHHPITNIETLLSCLLARLLTTAPPRGVVVVRQKVFRPMRRWVHPGDDESTGSQGIPWG